MSKDASKPAQAQQIEVLLAALRKLAPSGPHGFEGLVRDLLARITGMKYRLLKSGPQGGADAVSDPPTPGLLIAMEGKRYDEGTKLPLDELKAKLYDAIGNPELDLWILAATRELSAGDAEALREVGRRFGVAVEIIDSSAAPDGVSDLACLCAMFPDTTVAHLGKTAAVEASLRWIAALPNFPDQSAQLTQRLTNPEAGYANARTFAHRWLQNAMSDVASAKAYLGGYIDILSSETTRVRRTRLDQQLSEWWSNHRAHLMALLGDEGTGKTWEVLGWWLAHPDEMPLTLFITAGDVGAKEPAVVMAEALRRCTDVCDVAYWERRVRAWLRTSISTQPRFLLVVDGLNQNPLFPSWVEFLQRLFAPPYAGKVAVIVTDRPDDWTQRLSSLQSLSPPARRIRVSGFTDEELDELLARNGVIRKDFEPSLVDLMRVPRLCQLAIRLRRELQDSGDITRERLILEEWKDRLSRRAQTLRLNDLEFREWVADVGRRLVKDSRFGTDTLITRRELSDQLAKESGASQADLLLPISEIVDGHWLDPVGPHRFRVRPDLAAFALGLALVEHLIQTARAAPAAAIADFIDPLRGQDIAAGILRAATTAAFLDARVVPAIRKELTVAWLSEPNFGSSNLEAFWRLTPLAPDTICDIAELFWAKAEGGHFRDEVLIKALANAYQWAPVASTLVERSARWLGLYKSDHRAKLSQGATSNVNEERQERTRERRAAWDSAMAFPADATPLQCRDDVETGWLAHRTIAVLSYLPRRPFLRALRAWAVSRAIIGTPEEFARWRGSFV